MLMSAILLCILRGHFDAAASFECPAFFMFGHCG